MIHVLGAIGTICVLLAYFLVSSRRINSESREFQLLNLVGAIMLAVYSLVLTAWSSVALNAIWAVIALFALWRIIRARGRA